MSEHDHEQLHRYLDGEMDSAERNSFGDTLSQDSALQTDHMEFGAIGQLLREHVADELQDVDFGNFFEKVEAHIDAEGIEPVSNVAAVQQPKTQGPSISPSRWWSKVWAPALIGAAAAAAVIFFAMNRNDAPMGATPQQVVVDAVSNDGNKTVLVSMPVSEDHATVIWLIDGEKEDQEPIDGEDPI